MTVPRTPNPMLVAVAVAAAASCVAAAAAPAGGRRIAETDLWPPEGTWFSTPATTTRT
jgi:hypothetical protein